MIKHHRAIANFRLNEWPKAQASYTLFYNRHMSIHDLTPTIDFLADVLYSSRCSLVRYPVFTLVNVSMPKSNLSYGTMPIPHKSLYGLSDIVLTFAYTDKVRYTPEIKPQFNLKVGKNAYLWGTSLSYNTDYLTIFLPHNVYRSMKIGSLTSDVEFLYYTLGPWTKNFVRHNKFYNSNGYRIPEVPHNIRFSNVFRKTIPDLLNRHSYDEWIFNNEMWNRLPSIFSTRLVNDQFCDYYCRYLAKRYWKRHKSPNVKDIERRIFDYLEGAILDFLELLRGTSSYYNSSDIAGRTLVHLLSEQETSLQEFVDSFEPTVRELLIDAFSNVASVVDTLLQGKFSL